MGIDDTIERRRENRLPPEVFIVTQCVRVMNDSYQSADLKSLTPWQTVVVKDWYGHGEYTLQIVSHSCVVSHRTTCTAIRWT